MTKPLRVGLIGTGFMGRAHSNAFKRVNDFFLDLPYRIELHTVAARNQEQANRFAEVWGYGKVETDWRKLVEDPEIDWIDIASPNDTHFDIGMAAARHGKIITCEKPLAMNVAEAEEMTAAVASAGVANMVWFNYRRVPSIALAHQLVAEGRVGRSFHYRATYLQDWTISADVPQGGRALWRLDASVAGRA